MEDIRIMRRTDPEERTVSVGAITAVVIVPQDRKIVALTIDNGGTADMWVSMLSTVQPGTGMRIAPGDPPRRFNLGQDGNAITRGLFAIANPASAGNMTVWISYLQEE